MANGKANKAKRRLPAVKLKSSREGRGQDSRGVSSLTIAAWVTFTPSLGFPPGSRKTRGPGEVPRGQENGGGWAPPQLSPAKKRSEPPGREPPGR